MNAAFFTKKRVAVTGACGTVGSELVRQLLTLHDLEELICIDNNESELFFLEQRFSQHQHVSFFMADIRDHEALCTVLKDVTILFHTAAYKHVILCERSPFEAIQTNINGVHNIIEASLRCGVGRVIFTSSDKAVNPTNVMGASKLMGERLMASANARMRPDANTIFASTRFGNVLGSRGSVIPIFNRQIAMGGPITLTDPKMTRFIMSIEEAVELVISSAVIACGGEVFVTKMPVINIHDLAVAMTNLLAPRHGFDPKDIKIQIIGSKPGEKLYEELMNDEETRRTWELERYFAILPAYRSMYRETEYAYPTKITEQVTRTYNSSNESPLSIDELTAFLQEKNIIAGTNLQNSQTDYATDNMRKK